jgi:hypothetical protein
MVAVFEGAGEKLNILEPDYDAIELFRPKAGFFKMAPGLSGCPSTATLRQRIDLLSTGIMITAPVSSVTARCANKASGSWNRDCISILPWARTASPPGTVVRAISFHSIREVPPGSVHPDKGFLVI